MNQKHDADHPKVIGNSNKRQARSVLVVLGIIGSVASLVSIPLALYFYSESKEYRELIYYVHPAKAVLLKSGEISKLTARFEDKPIETDITAAQVAIWNRGKQSIKTNNVLRTVVIYTQNNVPILEATVRKSSRDITQLSLGLEELQKGRVTVSWSILEQDDGGVIQIVYAGRPDINLYVDGIVEGQRQINQLTFPESITSPEDQYKSFGRGDKFIGLLLLVLGLLTALLAVWLIWDWVTKDIRDKELYLFIPMALICLGLGLYFLLRARQPGPPFGF